MKKINLLTSIAFVFLFISLVFISCRKPSAAPAPQLEQPNLPEVSYDYQSKHGVRNDLATLGRVLFYDQNLSANNAVSCGSCHKQQYAFADNIKVNKGANGLNLTRNSPSIQGIRGFASSPAMFMTGAQAGSMNGMPDKENQQAVLLFWDGRQSSVADMVLNPVLNHNEMNIPDFETLVKKLSDLSYYPALFENAFGDKTITKERIAFAIEGFLACLNTSDQLPDNMDGFTTNNANIDVIGNFPPNFDPNKLPPNATLEEQGKFLFHNKYNCAQCHDPSNSGSYGTVVSPTEMFNIGLDEVYNDNGLGALTKKAGDKGVFKVPTLKNISLTAPYMHDGRFANLGEVIDHYSHGIKNSAGLSTRFLNADGTPKKLNILPAEKNALIAFLNTLRDDDFLTSPMYSDPFKK